MKRTVFKVILRKSEYKEQWSLLIESFPVFEPGKDKPLRKHAPLGRFITTPIFDKNSSGRTLANGKAYYRPKRDANEIIMCRSQKDQEACIFADKVRDLRQHEYDNQSLYTDSEAEQAAQNKRAKCDFIKYFDELKEKRHRNSSKSIQVNWSRELALMKLYTGNKPLPFGCIDLALIEDYRDYLLKAPKGGGKSGTISANTASTYFSIFKAGLHQAFIDGYLNVDLAAKVKNISYEESQREYRNHPILAVFHTNKQPLYVWQHIRVIGYLKFEGSIFVSSSSVISGRGLERASFIHLYGSMSASLQHATKV